MNSDHTVRSRTYSRAARAVVLAALCVACAGALSSSPAQSNALRLTVLHTGNLNGRMGATASVRAHYGRIQREVGRVLLLDAGGAMLRSEQSFDHGSGSESFTVSALNGARYDAWTLGGDELDRPAQQLSAALREARFAVLGANLHQPDTGRPLFQVQPFAVVRLPGVRVGVLGLSMGGGRAAVTACAEAVAYYVPILEQRCDVVCVLSSQGFRADSLLAAGVDGIDLIVGTRQDSALASPVKVGNAVLAAVGRADLTLGRVDLTLTADWKVAEFSGLQIPLGVTQEAAGSGPLGGWGAAVDGESLPLEAVLGTVAGLASTPAAGPALGNLVADLIVGAASAQVGFVAGTNVAPVVGPGPFRVLDLYRIYQRDLHLEVVTLQGSRIRAFLEGSLETPAVPFYPAGLEVVYDFSEPQGSRVVMAKVGDGLLDDDRDYRVVVEDGIAGAGGTGPGLGELLATGQRTQTGVLVRDLIGRHVRETGRLEGRQDGRVQQQ